VSWKGIALAAVPGVLLMAGGNGAVSIAEQTLQSSVAALIVASSALLMAVMTMILDRRLVSARVGAGLVLGFGGLVLLLHPQPGGHVPLGGGLVMLLAAVLWAAGSVFAGRYGSNHMSAAATSAFQMLSGGAALALGGVMFGERLPTGFGPETTPSLLALAYLVLIGALVGFTAYSWLLSHAPLSIVSTYAYVNPVVAIALGVLLLQEQLGWLELVASAVIVAGVALIVSAPRPAPRKV
jgi:drug/metabolite transporter (DMT)-like permease